MLCWLEPLFAFDMFYKLMLVSFTKEKRPKMLNHIYKSYSKIRTVNFSIHDDILI